MMRPQAISRRISSIASINIQHSESRTLGIYNIDTRVGRGDIMTTLR